MYWCFFIHSQKKKKKKRRKKKEIFILLTSQAGAPACGACTWGASKFSWRKLQFKHSLPFTRFNSIRRAVCQLITPVSANIYVLGQMLEPSVACIGQLSLSVNGSVRSPSHALIQRAPLFRLIKAEGCRDSRSSVFSRVSILGQRDPNGRPSSNRLSIQCSLGIICVRHCIRWF